MEVVTHTHFYANMRTLAQRDNLDVPLSDAGTLRELLERLIAWYPEMQPILLDERGNLRPDVPLFINGRNPRLTPAGIYQALAAGDVISIFSPIASGRMNVEVMRSPGTDGEEQIR